MPHSLKVDVLVIGGGNAALCAAISARRLGSTVLVLEKAPKEMRGGNTRHTRNLRAMHDEPTATLVDRYSEEEYFQDLLHVTKGQMNERLARLMIQRSGELIDWLQDIGVRFQPSLAGTLSLGRTNAFFLGGGRALLNAQYLTAEALGVDARYDADVRTLEICDGRFRSATATTPEGEIRIDADAVIVASGGFQANLEWLAEVWGDSARNFIVRGTPHSRGRMLKELLHKGAKQIGDPSQCHAVAVDARAPKYDGGIVTRLDCVCFSIVVNRDGKRFYDEGEDFWPKRYAIWGRLIAQQPGQLAYTIIDSKVVNNFMPSVFPPICAESLRNLARKLDIDPDALSTTVDQFNSSVRSGNYDPESLDSCSTKGLTPPKSHWALPIDTPPFYAYPLRPGITFTYLGVEVNENAAVIQSDGEPFLNIFAAGEVMAGNVLGQGYCAGTGMSIGSVFGRIAGENAACL